MSESGVDGFRRASFRGAMRTSSLLAMTTLKALGVSLSQANGVNGRTQRVFCPLPHA